MGEEDRKPQPWKVEKKREKRKQIPWKHTTRDKAIEEYHAPSAGLEKALFYAGQARDTANFEEFSKQHDKSKDKCYHCQKEWNHAKECPNADELEKELEECNQEGADFFNMDEEELKVIEGVGFLQRGTKDTGRTTCDRNKLYLDTCAMNHSMFAEEMLEHVHTAGVRLHQHCNAGAITTKKKGFWNGLKFWVNKNGIINLLSIPQLEKDGYFLTYMTTRGWRMYTPAGNTVVFKRDTGRCGEIPYINF